MTTDTYEDGVPLGLLDLHVEGFLGHLRTAGYAERTLRKKRSILAAFARVNESDPNRWRPNHAA